MHESPPAYAPAVPAPRRCPTPRELELEDVDAPWRGALTDELLRNGMPEEAVRKLLGGNALRVLEAGWR